MNTTNVDNTPVSLLEAMAAVLCVISTDVGGIPYLVEDRRHALLSLLANPARLASAIAEVLDDESLAGGMSVNGRALVEPFDWSGNSAPVARFIHRGCVMRVLYFYQYFTTPRGCWSTRVYEFARRSVERGARLTVVTSVDDKSDLRTDRFLYRREIDGIDVRIINVTLSNKHNVAMRLLTFFAYAVMASWYALTLPADVVVSSSGPMSVAFPGLVAHYLRPRLRLFEVRDLWPEGAISLGLLRYPCAGLPCAPDGEGLLPLGGPCGRAFGRNCRLDRAPPRDAQCGRSAERVRQLHDWRRACLRCPPAVGQGQEDRALRRDYGADQRMRADSRHGAHPRGAAGGRHRGRDDRRGQGAAGVGGPGPGTRVEEHPLSGTDAEGDHDSMARALALQHSPVRNLEVLGTCSPNKLFDSFAAGTPMIQNTEGWIKDLIERENCGVNVPPDDAGALAEAVLRLARDPEERSRILGRWCCAWRANSSIGICWRRGCIRSLTSARQSSLRRCLVTGASGFFGQYVARVLASAGSEVTVYGRRAVTGYRFLQADLVAAAPAAVAGFDAVYHAAGLAHVVPRSEAERQAFYQVNREGTRRLLEAIDRGGEPPETFLLISTVAVYGVNEGVLLDEGTQCWAADPYGESKRQAEDMLLEWASRRGVRSTVIRLPLVVGAGAPGNLRSMVEAIRRGRYRDIGGAGAHDAVW